MTTDRSGHTATPDGRIMFVGGGSRCADQHNVVRFFDPTLSGAAAWTLGPNETVACRWYPSVILLADSRVFTIDGHCQKLVQLSRRRGLLIMKAGGALECCPNPPCCPCPNGDRCGENECLNNLLTNQVYVIDLSQPTPQWVAKTPMIKPRLHSYLIALPDGKILASGGDSGDPYVCAPTLPGPGSAVLTPEVFDPYSNPPDNADPPLGTWTLMAPMAVPRMHHGSAILEVKPRTAGMSYQIFKPPCFFQAPRPAIDSCTSARTIFYGGSSPPR